MSRTPASLKILVVDDNPHICTIVSALLQQTGFGQVRTATSGPEALDILKVWDADAAVIDCLMEPMDGLELTRRLRKPTSPNPTLPIVMMTSYTERARILEARDAGVSELVAKPIVPARLLARLNAAVFQPRPFVKSTGYTGPSRRRATPGAGGPRRRLSDKTVQLV